MVDHWYRHDRSIIQHVVTTNSLACKAHTRSNLSNSEAADVSKQKYRLLKFWSKHKVFIAVAGNQPLKLPPKDLKKH